MMINIHGLVRGQNVEIGRDADTGGQTRYIIELANSLSLQPEIDYLDLVTRKITDKRVHSSYGNEREEINSKASIVRLSCGGKNYIRKEKLWPHLDEFTDRVIEYIQSQNRLPDFVHGHYADAGYVASHIANLFGIPLIFTGHSLGRNKLSFLKSTGMDEQKIRSHYATETRIEAEEGILAQADLVITSTNYEKESLYGQYEHREIPRYATIPPGADLDKFFPYYYYAIQGTEIDEEAKQAHHRTQTELKRFLFEPDKPLIMSLCRPDSRKNIDILIDVYGKNKELQAMANLVIFAGIRDDISTMEEGERQVLTDILLAMDKYDLYGKMAIPKYHNPQSDVPEMYRIAALSQGVFVSTSYLETFGLTFIEASACGLPFVATDKGGPVDIQKNCQSGVLTDIEDTDSVGQAIIRILTESSLWSDLSEKGINNTRKTYSWDHHCRTYIGEIEKLKKGHRKSSFAIEREYYSIGKRIHSLKEMLIVDIDDTLLGDDEAVRPLMAYMNEHSDDMGFGVATGRDIQSTRDVLSRYGIDKIEFIIASVGSEIYYYDKKLYDRGWSSHIKYKWKPDQIQDALRGFEWLKLQENPMAQREFKISYILDSSIPPDEAIPLIHTELMNRKLSYNLIHSHGTYVDILPSRVSKGKAIRYLSHKWKLPIQNIYTAGNSGNDRDMLTGSMKGIVVGNFEQELNNLKNRKWIYFSSTPFASGVLEGIRHWKSLKQED
ncbi:MAG: HAD-IIB family hydrolase [Spirochaetales bacterium]|nr:HAD-IIB family hydrolase [Spirochaetales bacterium]